MRTLLLARLLALGISSAASAAIVVSTYEGTVISGNDTAGLFGTPAADLAGLTYTATFTIDSTVNAAPGSYAVPSEVVRADGVASPFLSAFLTIGGQTIALPEAGGFLAGTAQGHEFEHLYSVASNADYVFVLRDHPDIPSALAANFTATGSLPRSFGFVTLRDGSGDVRLQADFNVTSVTSAVLGVPEPATWGLMILGFGATGALLRRKRFALT